LKVAVRLMASFMPNDTMNRILALKKIDENFTERWHAWRAGRIRFIADLVLCQDLIDERKRAMAQDKTGTMQEILRRVNNAKKYGILTRNPSLVTASNIFVMSKEQAIRLEADVAGKLSQPNIRQRVFDSTYAMILIIIDTETDYVTFYTRGIEAGTRVHVDSLKKPSKDGGANILEIMRSFNMGAPASF